MTSECISNEVVKESAPLIPEADRDKLRSYFHLFVGRPDSAQKVFTRRVTVAIGAVQDLHERILEKLNTHHIESLVANAEVLFEDRSSIQFGGWSEFEAHRWTTSKTTKELRLRWDFLLSVRGFELPQRHCITVKIASDVKPFEVLQAVLSKDPDVDDPADFVFAPVICRVDFISHSLSQELIALVDEWNKSLPKPEGRANWLIKLDRHKGRIAHLIRAATPTLIALAAIVLFQNVFSSVGIATIESVSRMMVWVLYSIFAIYISDRFSSVLAGVAYKSIDDFGRYSVLHLTSGDRDKFHKIAEKNKSIMVRFFVSSALSFLINVGSSLFVAWSWAGS
ncbi:hypothetical protein [Marilutibacter spongiae]|uniref:Uncharacterized protein n=1 Tax=Marilutibacter spongiae TaxID=2025720 RepID=A0A7W3TMS2_9GAMM|nr:hypothetical protein [Lysobacter spongiae]MBB1060909.1 hypothetical protein [Lysobacter spongiae]